MKRPKYSYDKNEKPPGDLDELKNLIDLGIDLSGLRIKIRENWSNSYFTTETLGIQDLSHYKECRCYSFNTIDYVTYIFEKCDWCLEEFQDWEYGKYPLIVKIVGWNENKSR